MKKTITTLTLMAGVALAVSALALSVPAGATTTTGNLFFNGGVVHTVVNPAEIPNGGTDAFYEVHNGAPDQLGITSVAPGSPDYHGGSWAVYSVTWNVTPFLLTSQAAVLNAQATGAVTVTRDPSADFRCPVQL